MKKIIFVLLLALVAGCKEKPYRVTGLVKDDSTAIAKVPFFNFNSSARSEGVMAVTIPSSFRLNMYVYNQGGKGACASMAVVGARSTEQYYRTNTTVYDTSVNVYSPEYLYNQAIAQGSGCSAGSSIITNLEILKNQGVCTWTAMPYSQNGCSTQPNAQQIADAAKYKISSYYQIYLSDSIAIKTALVNKHPLIVQVSIDDNFYHAGVGYIWNSFGTFINNHAIAIVGWDDSKSAWLAVNSFGTAWGDGGYIWIDYQFFKTIAYVVYMLNFDAPVPCPPSGTFIRTECRGVDKYNITANGSCGETLTLLQANSTDCGYIPPPTDVVAPVISSLTANPSVIGKFTKSVSINATATDNVAVTAMSITVNGITTNCTSGNCSYVWAVSKWLAPGTYNVTATAKDKAGNITTKTITVKK